MNLPVDSISSLNIAIAHLRTIRFDTDSHDSILVRRESKSILDDALKLHRIHHNSVGRSNHNVSLRILLTDTPASPSHTRSSVASGRLSKNMVRRDRRNLILDNIHIFLVSDYPEISIVAHTLKSVDCKLDKRAATSKNINKLFWKLRSGKRPET